jgi:hypothetical protein
MVTLYTFNIRDYIKQIEINHEVQYLINLKSDDEFEKKIEIKKYIKKFSKNLIFKD